MAESDRERTRGRFLVVYTGMHLLNSSAITLFMNLTVHKFISKTAKTNTKIQLITYMQKCFGGKCSDTADYLKMH